VHDEPRVVRAGGCGRGGNLSGVRGDPARLHYIAAAAAGVSVELCAEAGFAT